jgi:hypothetical protein
VQFTDAVKLSVTTKANQPVPVGAVGVWDRRKFSTTAFTEDPWSVWGTKETTEKQQQMLEDWPIEEQSLNLRIQKQVKAISMSTKQRSTVFHSGLTAPTPAWAWRETGSTFNPEQHRTTV